MGAEVLASQKTEAGDTLEARNSVWHQSKTSAQKQNHEQ